MSKIVKFVDSFICYKQKCKVIEWCRLIWAIL